MGIDRKGIILAGGKGKRLYPITKSISKQLLPVHNKPMIYYSLSTLMLAGLRNILIITTERDLDTYKELLGDGSRLGISLNYEVQKYPDGLAQAFILGENFIKDSSTALILGDNLFHGNNFIEQLKNANNSKSPASIFVYPVSNPSGYGVATFDSDRKVIDIEEKPILPKSNYAVTGLYFYDNTVIERATKVKKSIRGELEITDINKQYLEDGLLRVEEMSRGMTWFDMGTIDSLQIAGTYVKTLESRQGLLIGSPEEVAWRNGWIEDKDIFDAIKDKKDNPYSNYLSKLINPYVNI